MDMRANTPLLKMKSLTINTDGKNVKQVFIAHNMLWSINLNCTQPECAIVHTTLYSTCNKLKSKKVTEITEN